MAGDSNHIDWKSAWDILAHIAQVIGLAATGVWAYFNFIKSRTYYPRMELSVSGEIRFKNKEQYLVPRVTLNNIGKSKVQLNQSGTGYKIYFANGAKEASGELIWTGGNETFTMFEDHAWIEPGESIFDEMRLFVLPSDCIAAKVRVRLTAPVGEDAMGEIDETEWNCSTVVGPTFDEGDKPNV
jgi:hypothetical protein